MEALIAQRFSFSTALAALARTHVVCRIGVACHGCSDLRPPGSAITCTPGESTGRRSSQSGNWSASSRPGSSACGRRWQVPSRQARPPRATRWRRSRPEQALQRRCGECPAGAGADTNRGLTAVSSRRWHGCDGSMTAEAAGHHRPPAESRFRRGRRTFRACEDRA